MKKYLLLSLLCASGTLFAAQSDGAEKNSDRQNVGYSFGYILGKSNANAISVNDLDLNSFVEGFTQGLDGKDSNLSNEQMIEAIAKYKKKVEAEEFVELQNIARENLAKGDAFLATNAKKSTIKSTASGLQYEVISEGKGKKPSNLSNVKVHYEGRLLDGTIFDSSIARDEPVTLPLNKVIKGWQEGMQLMHEGSKYRFFIPAKLAYGEIGSGDAIPPNSTLIFDIELIEVVS